MTTVSSAASSALSALISPATVGACVGAAVARFATLVETASDAPTSVHILDAWNDTATCYLVAGAAAIALGWLSTRQGNLLHQESLSAATMVAKTDTQLISDVGEGGRLA
jgi:hypothetical protein